MLYKGQLHHVQTAIYVPYIIFLETEILYVSLEDEDTNLWTLHGDGYLVNNLVNKLRPMPAIILSVFNPMCLPQICCFIHTGILITVPYIPVSSC